MHNYFNLLLKLKNLNLNLKYCKKIKYLSKNYVRICLSVAIKV